MPLKIPSAKKKPKTIRWDAEPTLPRSSAGWEKMVAIGFATALGAGAVAFATILMVVSPAESEWQARPVTASLAPAGGSTSPAIGKVDLAPVSSARTLSADRPAAEVPPASSAAQLASAEPASASGGVTVQRPTIGASSAAPEPNNQRWARSAAGDDAAAQHLSARSAVASEAGDTPAHGNTDEQRVAALPLSALVAEPARPAEPSVEDDEQSSEITEPSAQRNMRLSSSANLRARPANGARVLATISGGTAVASFGCKGGWCEVSANGKRGFIASRFLGEKARMRRASASGSRKRLARAPKPAPQRKSAPSVIAAPVARTEKTTLPGVFATVPATSNGDR